MNTNLSLVDPDYRIRDNQFWLNGCRFESLVASRDTITLDIDGLGIRTLKHSKPGRDGRPTNSFKFESKTDGLWWEKHKGESIRIELLEVDPVEIQTPGIDHQKFRALIKQLYSTVDELEKMFPGRRFTPDGHMVGSIGECLVADAYGLKLMGASNEGYDAETIDGKKVEIKATQADRVAFRSCPDFTIIIKISRDGTFEEFYNGPGHLIWSTFEYRKRSSNGQYQISLNLVKTLNVKVLETQRILRV